MERNEFEAYEKLTTGISAKELSTLLRVSSALASTMDLGQVLQIAIESAADLLGLHTGAIYTLDNDTLLLGATVPPLSVPLENEVRRACLDDHRHIKQAIRTMVPVYLRDARTAPLTPAERFIADSRGLISILYFPLLLKDSAIGVFILGTKDQIREFSDHDIELSYVLSFQISLAVANAQLYKRAQEAITNLTQAYDATLEGWSRVLDMRDHVTEEHTHRVADLTVELAKRMGISAPELGHIRRGALLHDIGKMAIPDSILQKAEPLTAVERAIMETHPEKAYKILSQIDYLVTAMDIPYCHHERWDGSGYPRRLKAEQIPLAARLFAVVDVYDALTSDRPYRQAWSKEEALRYIQEQSGKHFAPDAVQVFCEMMRE